MTDRPNPTTDHPDSRRAGAHPADLVDPGSLRPMLALRAAEITEALNRAWTGAQWAVHPEHPDTIVGYDATLSLAALLDGKPGNAELTGRVPDELAAYLRPAADEPIRHGITVPGDEPAAEVAARVITDVVVPLALLTERARRARHEAEAARAQRRGLLMDPYAEGLGAVLVAHTHGLLMRWQRPDDRPDEPTSVIVRDLVDAEGHQRRGAADVRDAYVLVGLFADDNNEERHPIDLLAREYAAGRLEIVMPEDE